MIDKIIFYICLTLLIDHGGAADPWAPAWLSPQNDTVYIFDQTDNAGEFDNPLIYHRALWYIRVLQCSTQSPCSVRSADCAGVRRDQGECRHRQIESRP